MVPGTRKMIVARKPISARKAGAKWMVVGVVTSQAIKRAVRVVEAMVKKSPPWPVSSPIASAAWTVVVKPRPSAWAVVIVVVGIAKARIPAVSVGIATPKAGR